MKQKGPMKTSLTVMAVVSLLQFQIRAQYVAPLGELTGDLAVPTNAVVYEATVLPSPGTPPQLSSPSPSVNFPALSDNNTTIPPDTHGAVGPSHVMTMLNSQVRIQDRVGATNSTVALSAWWTGVGTFTSIFDPKVFYDPYSSRWIAVTIVDARLSTSGILIGVSQNSDPTGTWTRSRIKAAAAGTTWADYPSAGFNRNWIVVQVNMFTTNNPSSFSGSQILVFNKTNVYAGGTNRLVISDTTIGGTQVPAVTYDANLDTLYMLQTWNTIFTNGVGEVNGYLRLYTVTGTPSSPTFTATGTFPAGQPWAFSPGNVDFAPQSNTTVKIRNGDSRIQSVCYRNGSLWCAQTVFLPYTAPTRSSVQWWQITTNGVVAQAGRIDDTAGINFYAYPSIAVNQFGDALIGYSKFSTNQYASGNYSFRALTEGPNMVGTDVTLKAGEGRYYKTFGAGANRWGDYSATVVDPVNDADLWTIQEYAATPVNTGASDGDGRWGTWWGKVVVTVPPNDHFTNAYTISGALGTTNGTNLRATRETGETNHVGNTTVRSIWYQWTAPTNSSVTIDTLGSSFDTLLAVYTGSAVNSLTLVTNDDDSGDGTASRVVFTPTSGTTYRIAVDGSSGAQGNVVLNWNQPTPPMFTTHPQSQTKYAGDQVIFSSIAIGNPSPTYQWRFNGANISGATSASYTNNSVSTNDAGSYTVVASNTSGSVTSLVATLTVLTSSATLSSWTFTTNSEFRFTVGRETNLNYIIQASTNLSVSNWVSLKTNTAPFTFTNTAATNYPQRFFRAIYKP